MIKNVISIGTLSIEKSTGTYRYGQHALPIHLEVSFCFSAVICLIHCIDPPKTFTLLLKSKSITFETLSPVHVYRIEYVLYRQGPCRKRIVSAADRIVPALILIIQFA